MTHQEFYEFLKQREVARALKDIGVDILNLIDIADYFFLDGRELAFPDFLEWLLEHRGSNSVTMADIINLRKMIMHDLPRTIYIALQKDHPPTPRHSNSQAPH